MYTICETPLFTKYCLVYWTQEEYEEFKTFLALNPEAGDVEPNAGGSPIFIITHQPFDPFRQIG